MLFIWQHARVRLYWNELWGVLLLKSFEWGCDGYEDSMAAQKGLEQIYSESHVHLSFWYLPI